MEGHVATRSDTDGMEGHEGRGGTWRRTEGHGGTSENMEGQGIGQSDGRTEVRNKIYQKLFSQRLWPKHGYRHNKFVQLVLEM
jgi:hypothetical protein